MTNKINIVTEKVAQYKILDINHETYFDLIGKKLRIFYPKNVIINCISDIYFNVYYNGVYGQYGYPEDKDLGQSLDINDIIFKISDFSISNNQLFCNINFIDNKNSKYYQNIYNDLDLKFSAFFKIKNGFSEKKLNKVENLYFNDFYLIKK